MFIEGECTSRRFRSAVRVIHDAHSYRGTSNTATQRPGRSVGRGLRIDLRRGILRVARSGDKENAAVICGCIDRRIHGLRHTVIVDEYKRRV